MARVRLGWLGMALVGCYQPPEDLRDLDTEVPIVPFGSCAPNRVEWVSCVIDGDTFDLNSCGEELGERVRMLGIDAPETEKPGVPADCFANNAWSELIRIIDNQDVWLTFDGECTDLYDRTLAYVWIGDTEGQGPDADALFVNEWMLQEGFARLFLAEDLRLKDRLTAAEAEARARSVGLWSACGSGG